jgi:NAD(P)-dependent dehydrogenase (short-subunit alcohol dehydrogenase family)
MKLPNIPRRLEGKSALVTGSSSGIGRGIALRFAKEGANVAVNYSKSKEQAEETLHEIEKLGVKSLAVRANVSQTAEVDKMVSDTIHEFGRLDILVNNAGIFVEKSLEETTDEIWDNVIGVNLKGAFLCARRCVPEMAKIGKGKIINTASMDGLIAEPNIPAYCVSKAGIIGLTTSLALDLASKKINVNAIAPGQIQTPMIAEWLKNPELVKGLTSKTPLGRLGQPEDVAATAAFLAADESDFITGTVILVDGGWTLQ